jgi:hypothetical protein
MQWSCLWPGIPGLNGTLHYGDRAASTCRITAKPCRRVNLLADRTEVRSGLRAVCVVAAYGRSYTMVLFTFSPLAFVPF